MPVVLDASMALAILLPDEATPGPQLWNLVAREGAWVPPHWPVEVLNGLAQARRRRRLTADELAAAVTDLSTFNLTIDGEPILIEGRVLVALALDRGLTVYDAAYLSLAIRRGLPLATLDQRLKDAARAEGVMLV